MNKKKDHFQINCMAQWFKMLLLTHFHLSVALDLLVLVRNPAAELCLVLVVRSLKAVPFTIHAPGKNDSMYP